MASTTNEAENESVNEKVMQVSNCSQNANTGGNIYVSSVTSIKSDDLNNRELLKRRIIQNPDSKVKKRKAFVKKFRKEWMDEPIFRGWLHPIPNLSEKCWCSVCNVVLLCGHSELEKHASGKKHSDLILLNQLKGNLMDSSPPQAILDVINMEECRKDENNMNSSDPTVTSTLSLPPDGSGGSSLVFHVIHDVIQDGTLVEMKMDDYEKIVGNSQDMEGPPLKKVAPLSKQTVINVGNTTITKASPVQKTLPAILRQPSKAPRIIKVGSQLGNATQKVEDDRRTGILLEQYGTDTEDDDYDDDDDDLSDSQQMIKEMKAEAAYEEKKLLDQRRQEAEFEKLGLNSLGEIKSSDEVVRHVAEKELEVKLRHLQERRRQRFNIYKLRLLEMDARVRAAELELSRGEELHKLRVQYLQLLIKKQEQFENQERFEQEQYETEEALQ